MSDHAQSTLKVEPALPVVVYRRPDGLWWAGAHAHIGPHDFTSSMGHQRIGALELTCLEAMAVAEGIFGPLHWEADGPTRFVAKEHR